VYQPSKTCGAQLCRLSGLTWIRQRIPGGARGVRLKSYSPCSWAYAESFGSMQEPRKRLRVNSACGRSLSQRCSEKSLSQLQRPATKCFLNVRIARSAALRRWTPGGTNWKSTSSLERRVFKRSEASLWSRCKTGCRPALHNC
jgi:hypothetical protein